MPVLRDQEALPTLKTLEGLLIAERAMARKRMIGLGVFFALLVLLAIGGSFFVGAIFYLRVRNDLTQMSAGLVTLKDQTARTREHAETAVTKVEAELSKWRDTFLTEQKLALEQVERGISERNVPLATGLNVLRQAIYTLEERNRELNRELAELKTKIPDVAAKLEEMRRELNQLLPAQEADPATAQPNMPQEFVEVSVVPNPQSPPSTFRIPLPE